MGFTTRFDVAIIALLPRLLHRLCLLLKMKNSNFVDCFQCKHHYITWDPAAPKGCHAFGFKTQKMPSVVVFETSGERCLKFELKKEFKSKPNNQKREGWIA